jgi:hypothetical protein
MQISLREGDFNARLAKPTVNFLTQITFNLQSVIYLRHPDEQLKIERTVPETAEQNPRLGVLHYSGMGQRALFQCPYDQPNVRPIRHPNRNHSLSVPISQSPIRHLIGDKIGIGDDDIRLSNGPHRGGAETNLRNLHSLSTQLNRVSYSQRPFEEEDQPAHKVVHDRLQTKADADSQRLEAATRAFATARGEPWLSVFDPSRLRAHVQALGFVVIEDVGPAEARARYFAGRRDGLRTLPFVHLMKAQVDSRH